MDSSVSTEKLSAIVETLRRAAPLKHTLRSGQSGPGRRESTAEHSWRLVLLALLMANELPGVDVMRLLKLCLLHDLGEAITGDVPATAQSAETAQARDDAERAAIQHIFAPMGAEWQAEMDALITAYQQADGLEAQIAKGLDKVETILTHAQGPVEAGIDHAFNLEYGRVATDRHPVVQALRVLADEETQKAIRAENGEEPA